VFETSKLLYVSELSLVFFSSTSNISIHTPTQSHNIINSYSMLSEGARLVGESGKTYLAVSSLGQSNVWTAVEQSNDPKKPVQVVVIKEPGEIDTQPGWPSFQSSRTHQPSDSKSTESLPLELEARQ
jgi:hypothetical protein